MYYKSPVRVSPPSTAVKRSPHHTLEYVRWDGGGGMWPKARGQRSGRWGEALSHTWGPKPGHEFQNEIGSQKDPCS